MTVAFRNGSVTILKGLGSAALSALDQMDMSATDLTSDPVSYNFPIILSPNKSDNFSELKAGGLSDDQAMDAAIAKGGTLVIDAGMAIHLTRTYTITKPMQFISSGRSVITSSSAGGLFLMAAPAPGAAIAPVLFQGLNIINLAASGSIITMSGDHTAIRDSQFANVAGNSASMVKFQGYNQVIENSVFYNNEPTAYCWDANWVDGYNGVDGEPVNDRIVGGAAFGPGKGGLIENVGLHFTEGFSIDDWSCATQGIQIQARDVYSLEIRGGVFDGATGSAIVLGGGNALVQSVVIQGTFISAAGTAIDAAPVSGSGINDLTVRDNQISGAGTGIAVNERSGHAALIGNTITSSSLGLSIINPASQVMVIGNTVTSAASSISDSSAHPNQVYFGNTINGSLNIAGSTNASVIFTSNGGTAFDAGNGISFPLNPAGSASLIQAVQMASVNVHLPDFVKSSIAPAGDTFTAPGVYDTFSHFKYSPSGTALTDDQAFAAAVANLGAVHGTFVIDNGLVINLTRAVDITNSMAIVSAGSGLDTSSLITTTSSEGIFRISAAGSVLIQGLNLKSGSSGSIITTGTGNTVLRNDGFTNVAGNVSPMIIIQGSNQLLKDSYFQNNEAEAYDWSAAYKIPSSPTDTSTTISGGWAYGIGKGGLIGGDDAGPVIQGFNIYNWTIVGSGATQIEADNVTNLDIEGGVFDGSSGSAIVLGGGATKISSATVNGAFISASAAAAVNPTTGIAINAGLAFGSGVANLVVTDNQINTVGTGLLVGGQIGSVTVSGNDLRTGKIGLDLLSPTGTAVVVGNQINPNSGTTAVRSTAATGSTQTYVANAFNGAIQITQSIGSTVVSLDNIGSGTTLNAVGIRVADLSATLIASTTAQIASLSTTVLASLSSSEIAALTPTQIGALTTTQICVLTTAQIGAMSSADVGALTKTQLGVLTTAQLRALSPLQMIGFSPSQLAGMTTTQLEILTTNQFGRDYLFDAGYYLAQNPDVASAGLDPYQDYMTYGWKEGRNPSPFFNTNYYLAQNPAVRAAGVNPFTQFEISGWSGSTDPSAAFSDSKYVAANPDVAAAKMNPLLHYIISGQYEGRSVFASEIAVPALGGKSVYVSGTTNTGRLLAPVPSAGAEPGQLTLKMSETGWHGDSQFNLTVDGAAIMQTFTASASHAAGQSQTFTIAGLYAPGPHTVGIKFLNSLKGLDGGRELFIDGMTFNGQDTGQSASLLANGTILLSTAPTTRSTAVTVNLSEDAFRGDAMALISIDGKVQDGVHSVSASHSSGATQAIHFQLDLTPGAHTATVTPLNGLNEGPGASRNLYLDSIDIAGSHLANSAALLGSNSSSTFAFTVQPASAANGSLYVTAGSPSAMSLLVPSV